MTSTPCVWDVIPKFLDIQGQPQHDLLEVGHSTLRTDQWSPEVLDKVVARYDYTGKLVFQFGIVYITQ